MDFSLITLLIVLPLVIALATLVIGRWPAVANGVGIVAALGIALLAFLGSRGEGPDAAWVVLGRTFELPPFVAVFISLLAMGLVALFALQWIVPGPRAVVPGGLAALGFLTAALTVQPFAYGAIFLVAAAAVTMPALVGDRSGAATASWRAFVAVTLAMPLLIAAGWMLDSGQAQSNAPLIALLLAALLLLGGFPFYIWISGVAREVPLSALVLLMGIVGAGIYVWLAQVISLFPAVRGSAVFQTAVLGSVLLSGAVAAFGLSRAADWRSWLAYALVVDAGMQVASLLVSGTTVIAVAGAGAVGRLIILLLTVGVLAWIGEGQDETPSQAPSVWPRVMAVFAGLALIGLPLTPEFGARWMTLSAMAAQSPLVTALTVAAMGIAATGVVRCALFGTLPLAGSVGQSSRGVKIVTITLFALALLIAFLSPFLLEYFVELVSG
ncbi:MAG: hypothetical protein R3C44_03385 [Chloroflexota bacterium]